VRVFQTVRNVQPWSSFTESLRGVYVGVSTAAGCPPPLSPAEAERAAADADAVGGPLRALRALLPPPDAVHSVGYTLGWMNLSDASAAAGRGVQSQLGDQLRGGLAWQALVDRRGGGGEAAAAGGFCPGFGGLAAGGGGSGAEDGWALRWSAELGGLAPGVAPRGRFAKAGIDWAFSREVADLDAQGGGGGGEGGGEEAATAAAAAATATAAAAAQQQQPSDSSSSSSSSSIVTFSGDSASAPFRLGRLSVSLAASGGALLPWQPLAVAAPSAAAGGKAGAGASSSSSAATSTRAWWDRPSCIADRFFLGGPDSLRGFDWRGAGPSDERRPRPGAAGAGSGAAANAAAAGAGRDALGGDLFASLFAALEWLPGHPVAEALNLRLHAFVNGGTAALLSSSGGGGSAPLPSSASLGSALARRASDAASAFRWSAGLGLVVPTPAGRFEANWAWVLASRPGDRARPGLQLGFATSPLLR
jgi:outer membrane protein insertion porin family